jgi:hypothetical protein
MRKYSLVLASLSLFIASALLAFDCNCGPDYCLGESAYTTKLNQKKLQLKTQGYPADMIALLDKDGKCVAAVTQGPDGFSIKTVKPGESLILSWTKENEDMAKQQLIAGQITTYYKMNTARALACCGEKKAEDRADWNAALGMNLGLAIKCVKTAQNAVSCAAAA